MKQKYIETPYGRKTPELLCRAMDALAVHDDLVAALAWLIQERDAGTDKGLLPDGLMNAARCALAKAKGEA